LHDSTVAAAHGNAHGHNPALLHHFATEEQQRNSASLGMWIFLATEVMFFGGLFCAYLIYRRWYFDDFAAASKSINATLGATNTAVGTTAPYRPAGTAATTAPVGSRPQ